MADVPTIIDSLVEDIDMAAGNTALTRAESIEIYESLASHCRQWAQTIRDEDA